MILSQYGTLYLRASLEASLSQNGATPLMHPVQICQPVKGCHAAVTIKHGTEVRLKPNLTEEQMAQWQRKHVGKRRQGSSRCAGAVTLSKEELSGDAAKQQGTPLSQSTSPGPSCATPGA